MRTPVLRSPAVLLGVPAVAVAALGVGSMVGGVTPTADHSVDPGRPDAAATQRVPGAQAAPPLVQAVPATMPVVPLAPVSTVSTVDDAAHPGGGGVGSVSSEGASKGDDAAPAHAGRMLTFDRAAPAQALAAPAAPATSDAAVSRTTPAAAAPAPAPLARHAAAPAAAAEPHDDADTGGGSLLAVSTPVVGLSVLSFG